MIEQMIRAIQKHESLESFSEQVKEIIPALVDAVSSQFGGGIAAARDTLAEEFDFELEKRTLHQPAQVPSAALSKGSHESPLK